MGLFLSAGYWFGNIPLVKRNFTLVVVALTFATVVVNLAPANPYYAAIVQELNPGRFHNFNGLTQTIATAWPFLAVLYVMVALGTARRDRN